LARRASGIGFSQFVDLQAAPTEETLCFLLGRRAAGVLPRNHKDADLLIPIFRGTTASFVLIQVKNRHKVDQDFPATATSKLTPESVFGDKSPLSSASPAGMIRVCMTMRECHANKPVRQNAKYRGQCYVLLDHADNSCATKDTYALVLRGFCRSQGVSRGETTASEPWPFLTPTTALELERIANAAHWDPMEQVASDLERRDKAPNEDTLSRGMSSSVLEETAAQMCTDMDGAGLSVDISPGAKRKRTVAGKHSKQSRRGRRRATK
jgi:hypothetical protein